MIDKHLVKKQLKREAQERSGNAVETGIVVGHRDKGLSNSRPDYQGQVLMGSSEGKSGMEWSDDVSAKKQRFNLNRRKDVFESETTVLEGKQLGEHIGSSVYTQVTYYHKIPNLSTNLLKCKIMTTGSGATDGGWHECSDGHTVITDWYIRFRTRHGGASTARTYDFRIYLTLKAGHMRLIENKTTEV